MARAEKALTGVSTRIAIAILIVLLTYNPLKWSYFHWVWPLSWDGVEMKVLGGLVLLVAYVVLLRATFFSIGALGIVLVSALVAAIVWVLVSYDILNPQQPGFFEWIILIGIGFILGVGLSWAIIRRRLSGQVSVDDVETTE